MHMKFGRQRPARMMISPISGDDFMRDAQRKRKKNRRLSAAAHITPEQHRARERRVIEAAYARGFCCSPDADAAMPHRRR